MKVSVGERWEDFVAALVEEGRYGSAGEVVREGLRLVEEREAKLRGSGASGAPAPARSGAASAGAAAPVKSGTASGGAPLGGKAGETRR